MSGGVSGNALEWALALLRAPGERHALRSRSLPPQMEALLAVAAEASPEALAEISRNLGEPEGRVREAARFYVREVLFHPDADAYRILGVAPASSSDQIKAHYRLLQHWLHPDRQRSEDDSVFAARVNTAWNALRNQKRRTAYDETLRKELAPNPAHVHQVTDPGPVTRRAAAWVQLEENIRPPNRWRHGLPVLTLLGVCALLGWLAIHDGQRAPEAWDWKGDGPQVANAEAPAGETNQAPETKMKSQSNPARSARVLPAGDRSKDAVTLREGTVSAKAVAMRVARHMSVVPSKPTTEPTTEPRRIALQGESLVAAPMPTPQPLHKPPPLARPLVAATPPKLPASRSAATLSALDSIATRRNSPASELTKRVSPPPATVGHAAVQPVSRQIVAAVEATGATYSSEPDFARIKQARQVGSQLLQYFRKMGQPEPPIWNSPAIMSSAGGMRTELHEQGESRLDEPQWRINATSATMSTAFHAAGEGAGMRGVLAVDMVWRENRWLVTGLTLEHAR